jgi:hypothetical protein
LQYENVGNTFTNSKGCECSEIDYFIHNIPKQQIIAEKAIIQIDTNTSDHYPMSMSFKLEHNKDDNLKIPNPKRKIKWEKLDKDLYRAMVTEKSTALYERMRITTISSQEAIAITQVNTLLTSAAQICSGNKATYHAKPKLKVWNADIKVALKEKRNSYNIWLKNGKSNDLTNHLLLQKKHTNAYLAII